MARGIFFLPIIVASGVILSILNGDVFSANIMSSSSVSRLFNSEALGILLGGADTTGVGRTFIAYVTGFVDGLFALLWRCGIQTLLFITALQSIPTAMYEAAKIEGGTAWEIFWKITFPMLSPTILLNLIYTIIDSFGDYGNSVVKYIIDFTAKGDFSYSAALMWVYTVITLFIVGIAYLLVNRYVFYE